MLLELAVADAMAIPWEFVKDPDSHGLVNDLQTYQMHPKYGPAGELNPSQYTDDTLRSIATARVVINGRNIFNPLSYIKAIQQIFREDRRKGWSKRFYGFLEENLDAEPEDFLRGIKNRAGSNGAIMGCLPLGYLKSVDDVKLAATIQAITTHSVTTAVDAQRMALAAHFFIGGGQKCDLEAFVNRMCEGEPCFSWDQYRPSSVSMQAYETVEAVMYLLLTHNSQSDILQDAIEMGGDTDSVAALAVGIASCCPEYAADLPRKLFDELDNGSGKTYLETLDNMLKGK